MKDGSGLRPEAFGSVATESLQRIKSLRLYSVGKRERLWSSLVDLITSAIQQFRGFKTAHLRFRLTPMSPKKLRDIV